MHTVFIALYRSIYLYLYTTIIKREQFFDPITSHVHEPVPFTAVARLFYS